jgi:hypothetical protein
MPVKERLAALRDRAAQHGLEILGPLAGRYTLTPAIPGLKRDIMTGADLDAIEAWLDRYRP